ncbi:MAG: serine hydrolase [SAR324 cluster bacterium]|nr:serine hydrolase [SAR324 cluster bacterium]
MKDKLKKIFKWVGILSIVIVSGIALYAGQFILFAPEPATQPSNVKTVDDLDHYLSALVTEGLPPAMDVTVLKQGKTVFSKAYGIANGLTGEIATKEHVYHFWSMTKSFTAVAVFQLVENGKISLNESITTYLPNYSPVDESGTPVKVTIEQLLNHTSGLPDFDTKMAAWIHLDGEPRYGETRMVNERFQEYQTLIASPGTVSKYRNIGYVLLGAVIETVTGGTYEDYIRQFILIPLKMNRSDFIYRPDMMKNVAKGSHSYYHFLTLLVNLMGPEGGLDSITEGKTDDRHWLRLMHTDYAASTSLIGTGLDMSRFGQMLLNRGELDGVRILSEESADEILYGGRFAGEKEQVAAGEKETALGFGAKTWFDQGVEIIGHGGGGAGFALQYFVVPQKELVVVVLTNQTLQTQYDVAKVIVSVF